MCLVRRQGLGEGRRGSGPLSACVFGGGKGGGAGFCVG